MFRPEPLYHCKIRRIEEINFLFFSILILGLHFIFQVSLFCFLKQRIQERITEMKIFAIIFYLTQKRRKQPRAAGAEFQTSALSLYLTNKQQEMFNLLGKVV